MSDEVALLRQELRATQERLYRLENARRPAPPHVRDLADTKANKATDGQVLAYEKATGLWKPVTPAGVVLGCSVERVVGLHSPQSIPASTFTTLTFGRENFSDGNFTGGAYQVAETGVYFATVRVRLADGVTPIVSYGTGVHTALTDGPWFQWQDSSSNNKGSTTKRSSQQTSRVALFEAGVSLIPYVYVDGVTVNVNDAAFDVVYLGAL